MQLIAEIGSHHNCSLKRAYHLIDLAIASGFDAVKFQLFHADTLTVKNSPAYWDTTKTQHDVFSQRDHFTDDDWIRIAEYCADHKIEFMATPFDLDAVDLLEHIGVKRYKIASGDITYLPLLRRIAQTRKPVILSTGASTFPEITQALRALSPCYVTLLHCVLSYPAPHANLTRITRLRRFGRQVGYSHHVIDPTLATLFGAALLGASIIEVHFTDDVTRKGDDHAHALTPAMAKQFFKGLELMGLNKYEEILPCELQARIGARRSVVAAHDIIKGEPLALTCKRPGTGRSPMEWDELQGVAMKDYKKDEAI